ncbi:MAG: alkaline shock response membrane anchor protein AmaP [Chloroflexi bacterium]|nr:alkaline shock response membrane anchor protein AmaP [Chloroflexota bacterium]
MNLFNRFLVILMALVGIAFWLAAVFVVWALPGEVVVALRDSAAFIRGNVLLFQGLMSAFGVSSILVLILILVGEFSAQEPAVVRIAQVSGGVAAISVEAIAQRVKADLEQIPQVRLARPRIRNRRSAIDVMVELRTDPETHLPSKANEVCQAVRHTVEERLGVQLKDVRVQIQPDTHSRPMAAQPARAGEGAAPGEILVPGALRAPQPPAEPQEPTSTARP